MMKDFLPFLVDENSISAFKLIYFCFLVAMRRMSSYITLLGYSLIILLSD
jgi:hypothetical protein